MNKVKKLGAYDLDVLNGWLPIKEFCRLMPFSERTVRYFRSNGKWLDNVVTKCVDKTIWVNVWEVHLNLEKNGLH